MVRYDKIFSIIDIKEENMKKWVSYLPSALYFGKNTQPFFYPQRMARNTGTYYTRRAASPFR